MVMQMTDNDFPKGIKEGGGLHSEMGQAGRQKLEEQFAWMLDLISRIILQRARENVSCG